MFGVVPERDGATTLSWLSGTLAGASSALVASPFALVRTRLQATSEVATFGHQHKGVTGQGLMQSIIREEGIRGIYAGSTTQMIRVGVTTGLQLAMYDTTKSALGNRMPERGQGLTHLLTALSAGVFTALVAHPIDTVSVRVYHQTASDLWYTGPLDAVRKTIRAEGVIGLYKGFSATFLRQMPHTTVTFLTIEYLRAGASPGVQ
jgi:solute carrier family 25, member 34/35